MGVFEKPGPAIALVAGVTCLIVAQLLVMRVMRLRRGVTFSEPQVPLFAETFVARSSRSRPSASSGRVSPGRIRPLRGALGGALGGAQASELFASASDNSSVSKMTASG